MLEYYIMLVIVKTAAYIFLGTYTSITSIVLHMMELINDRRGENILIRSYGLRYKGVYVITIITVLTFHKIIKQCFE